MSANKLLLLISLFGYGATTDCPPCKAGLGGTEGRPAKSLRADDRDERDATIKQLESAFATLPSLHVKYDLYVCTETESRKVLSVEEALSGQRFFNRIVHWYDQTLYQFKEEKWDPFLNSYYWLPEKEVLLQETRRDCTVSDPTPLKSMRPRIQGYLGFCGILVPKRREFLAGGDLPPAEGYDARHYYFPLCFNQPPSWNVSWQSETRARIVREIGERTDTILFQVRPTVALIERQILRPDLKTNIQVQFDDFVEVSEKLSMPRDMVVRIQPDQKRVYRVNYLSTNPPVELFTPPLKPGTRVVRENSAESYTVPGGIKFLNFTIARMRRAGQYADTPVTRIRVAWAWLGGALIVIASVTLLGHLRRPYRHE